MRARRTFALPLCLIALAIVRTGPAAAALMVNVDHETTGINAPRWLAFSPDGAHLYVVNATGNDGLAVFEREGAPGPNFGQLTFVENDSGGGACGANALKSSSSVAVSPDGSHVYVTSKPTGNGNSLTAWSRNPGTGELSCIQKITDNINLRRGSGLSISSDGTTLYVTATSARQERVNAYSRDTGTGLLTFLQSFKDGTGGADSLAGPTATAVGPGDLQVYVTAANDSALTRFARNLAGNLSSPLALIDNQGGVDGLAGASFLALSADGRNVYTAAPTEDGIGVFARDGATGALTFLEVETNLSGPVTGLDGVTGVAVSPDGAYVFGAASLSGALSIFSRDPATGALAFLESITDPGNLDGARAVAVSSDGQCVYVAATTANSVEVWCFDGRDFGDAPAPFATLAADAGASHSIGAAAFLGAGVPDIEADGQPGALADGDDLAGDDEEGVTFVTTPVLAGQTNTITVTGTGVADAWIDFNGDGDWDEAGEQILAGVTLPAVSATFSAPALTLDGFTTARFRARPAGSDPLAPAGGGDTGEVEDHRVELSANSFQVAVTRAGNGSGTVTSAPAGLDCGTTCTAPFAENADVDLTATADTGSDFTAWSGASAGECSGESCAFTNLTENKAVTATFTLQTFTLSVAVASGSGTVEDVPQTDLQCGTGGAACSNDYDYGTQVQLTAIPDSGWVFTGWSGACANVIGDCVVTVTQVASVQASFALNVFLLAVDPAVGTGTGTVRVTDLGDASFVDCRAEIPADPDCTTFHLPGTQLSLSATPDGDSLFTQWTGDCSGGGACNLTMNSGHGVGADFLLTPDLRVVVPDDRATLPDDGGAVTIVVTVSNAGAVDPSGDATVTSLPMTNVTVSGWTCAALGTTCANASGTGTLNEIVSLPVGAELTFTFDGTAPTPALGGITISVTVAGPDPEGAGVAEDNTDAGFFAYFKIFTDDLELGNFTRWSVHP